MITIAFDLSTHTGYCVHDTEQKTRMTGSRKFQRKTKRKRIPDQHIGIRQLQFARWVGILIALHNPQRIIVESPQAFKNRSAYVIAYGFYSILLMMAAKDGRQWAEVNGSTMKKWATGNGRAEKEQMLEAAMKIQPVLMNANDNEVDAFFVSLYHHTHADSSGK